MSFLPAVRHSATQYDVLAACLPVVVLKSPAADLLDARRLHLGVVAFQHRIFPLVTQPETRSLLYFLPPSRVKSNHSHLNNPPLSASDNCPISSATALFVDTTLSPPPPPPPSSPPPPPTFLLGFVQASFFPSVKHKMPSGERYVCPYCSRKSAKSPGAACTRKSCLQLRVHASSPPSRPLGRRK